MLYCDVIYDLWMRVEEAKNGAGISPFLSINTKKVVIFLSPIRGMNRYQQYLCFQTKNTAEGCRIQPRYILKQKLWHEILSLQPS